MLWYVLLRERNVLLTQEDERRRLGVVDAYGGELLKKRTFRVSISRRAPQVPEALCLLPSSYGLPLPSLLQLQSGAG